MNEDASIEVTRLLDRLLGNGEIAPLGIYPSYLEPRYDREYAARALSGVGRGNDVVDAALVRASVADEEEYVRIYSLISLSKRKSPMLDTALAAATFDKDPKVRLAALEGMVICGSILRDSFAKMMSADADEEVRTAARKVSEGLPIGIFEWVEEGFADEPGEAG